eukprot:NODE_3893_length_718_cov_81.428999_g3285_i0.p1 GENE.NODE_3893_length_718_cov_81.428999_g3285_i0~~NODE_3893_length_718_cov_81.428999_g3285_i0.p1  ORF type:complete len:195 (-),score=29.88 NODE_3893_length_718_cov_81.428999_g3285_i0:70-654(-)
MVKLGKECVAKKKAKMLRLVAKTKGNQQPPVEQLERAFQKQSAINLNRKKPALKHLNNKGFLRYWKRIGLGFKTPKSAVEGSYIDKKCPFTSRVSIRGRIFRGTLVGQKMKRTAIVRRNYVHYCSKYQRFEKRHTNFPVHMSPCFSDSNKGDEVIFGECRPISKTVHFNAIQVNPRSKKDQKQQQERLKQFSKF